MRSRREAKDSEIRPRPCGVRRLDVKDAQVSPAPSSNGLVPQAIAAIKKAKFS